MSIDNKAFTAAIVAVTEEHGESAHISIAVLKSLVMSYESAKQPVRVDVEKCAAAINNADAWVHKSHDEWCEALAKSVLSVVKGAAKEMGVELVYE